MAGQKVPMWAIFNAQDNMSRKMRTMGSNMERSIGGSLKRIGALAATAFSVKQVYDFTKASTQAFISFQKNMTEVFTLMPELTGGEMAKMQQQALDFAEDMGTLPSEVIPALYEALSSGVPKDNVFDFLETANKAAIGGVTTLQTAVDGLTSVTNAYGTKVLSVQRASDIMFQAVLIGKTTFEELSSFLYNVVPTAVGAGVAFEDVAAAIAAMTAQGVPTNVATTQLRQTLVELSKSGTETDKIFRKIAGKSFKDFIAGGGNLQDAFQLMEDEAKRTNKGVNDLFSSVEAGSAVLSLTGQGTQMFTDAMKAMQDSAGSTEAAYDRMEDSMSRKIDRLKASWEVMKIGIGEVIMNAILPIMEYAAEHMDEIGEYISAAFETVGGAIEILWSVARPFLEFIRNNPDLMATFLAGIGAAIITHKVVQGIKGVADSMQLLNTAFAKSPIGIIVSVIGLVVALGTAITNAFNEAKEHDLAEHFGDITLSAEEMSDVAKRIIRTKSIERLGEAMSALDSVEEISSGIQSTVEALNRTEWKVGIGLELTDSEKGDYQRGIEQFIQESQQLIEQQHYAFTLALNVFSQDTPEDNELRKGMDAFYLATQSEVAKLGTKLQEKVNAAFEDGLLDIDEAKEIAELRQQIADITAEMSMADFEAKLMTLGVNMSGAELTPESFKGLQENVKTEVQAALEQQDEAFTYAVGELNYRLKKDPEYSQKDFEIDFQRLVDEKLAAQAEITLKASDFSFNTLSDTFGPELSTAMGNIKTALQNEMQTQIGNMEMKGYEGLDIQQLIAGVMNTDQLDPTTKANIKDMFEQMKPTQEDLMDIAQSYTDAGKQIPAYIQQGIMDNAAIGALAGDAQSLQLLIGSAFSEADPKYQEMLKQLNASGEMVPESIMTGMNANKDLLSQTGGDLLGHLKARLEDGITANIPVTMRLTTTYSPSTLPPVEVPGHAKGTLYGEDAYIAGEDGPELIIGRAGSTVFPHSETEKIIKSVGGPRVVDLNINGKVVAKGASKDDIWDSSKDTLKQILLEIIEDEAFEEGDGTYDY